MNMNTFFQICIYITLCMITVTLAINFVSASGFYPTEVETGVHPGTNTSGTFSHYTQSPDYTSGLSITNIWLLVLTATGAIGIVVAWITKSTAIIGVYIFSVVFWASYINSLSVLHINNYVPLGWIGIFTGGMAFIFVAAVAGMLSGSG